MMTIIFASLMLQAAQPAPPQIVFERPPRARAVEGLIVTLAHVMDPVVAPRDRVEKGQAVASVGNNGFSRAPHVHIGVHRDGLPFQIRWDQREMARHAADGAE